MEGEPKNESQAAVFKQRLFEILHNVGRGRVIEYLDYINTKLAELSWKYPNTRMQDYELYHILIGSTPEPDQQFIGFDLKGGELSALVEELENKYKKS